MSINSDDGEEDRRKKYKMSECPHCGNPIEVVMHTRIEVVIPDDASRFDWRSALTAEQLMVVESAEKSGMIKEFEKVVRRVKPIAPPKDIARFFLTFLRSVVQKRIPAAMIFKFRKTFGGTNVEFWSAQGLGIVVVDKSLRAFLPLEVVAGKSIRAIGKKSGMDFRIPPDEKEFSEIIRTRFGFVSGKGYFFDAMRNKSIGDFARPSL